MDLKTLREYVKCVLNEKIRSKSDKQRFNLSTFKNFDDFAEAYSYALQSLKYLGKGSSRVVFVLSSSKVVKMAHPDAVEKGRAQNEAELKTFQNLKAKNIVAKTFDHDDSFNWLISELVRPLASEKEFNDLIDLHEDLSLDDLIDLANEYGEKYAEVLREENVQLSEKTHAFIQAVNELLHTHDVLASDMHKLSSWGKTADNRVVLLDYGYNLDVGLKHYHPELV